MKSKINLPINPPAELEVEFGVDGMERFWINGELIDSINSLGGGKKNSRLLNVNGHQIKIEYSFEKPTYYSRVYFDSDLLTEHLFEETKYGASKG